MGKMFAMAKSMGQEAMTKLGGTELGCVVKKSDDPQSTTQGAAVD